MARKKTAPSALDLIRDDVGHDPEFERMLQEERLHATVARMIHDARTAAGLTQQQLAERIGTAQPNIARLEDADYEGHSLSMLRRIAEALGQRLEIRFVALRPGRAARRRASTRRASPAR